MGIPHSARSGPGKPIVLMHIAKTAGTAARVALEDVYAEDPTRNLTDPESLSAAWRADPWEHAGYRLISGHFGTDFINRLPFPVFRTAFVRDPVDRCLSHYISVRDLDLSRVDASLAAKIAETRMEPLEKLLASDDPFIAAQYRNHQVRQFAGRTHLEPGTVEPEDDQALLHRALSRAEEFDVIGVQGEYPRSLRLLFNRANLGTFAVRTETVINASRASRQNAELRADESLRAEIARHNEADITLFQLLAERLVEELEEFEDEGTG